jgi:hypothetical protein
MQEVTVSPVQSKRCRQCGTVRSADEFHVEARTKDGLRAQCRPCRNRLERARRAKCVDSERARRRELYQTKLARQEGIAVELATRENRREIRRARRMGWDTRNELPDDLIQDLRGGISVRNKPDAPLSSFEKHRANRKRDAEANRWLQAHDPDFGQGLYQAV